MYFVLRSLLTSVSLSHGMVATAADCCTQWFASSWTPHAKGGDNCLEVALCGPRIVETSGHKLSHVLCVGLLAPSKLMVKLDSLCQTQN